MRLYKHGTYINQRYTFTQHQIGKRISETEIKYKILYLNLNLERCNDISKIILIK